MSFKEYLREMLDEANMVNKNIDKYYNLLDQKEKLMKDKEVKDYISWVKHGNNLSYSNSMDQGDNYPDQISNSIKKNKDRLSDLEKKPKVAKYLKVSNELSKMKTDIIDAGMKKDRELYQQWLSAKKAPKRKEILWNKMIDLL
jgi:hypothetical protein